MTAESLMADIPAEDRWYYTANGKDYGPVAWSVIESMVSDDRLSRDDLVVKEGDSFHVRIAEVLSHRLNSGTSARKIDVSANVVPIGVSGPEMSSGTVATPGVTVSSDHDSNVPAWTKPAEQTLSADDVGEYQLEPPPPPSPPILAFEPEVVQPSIPMTTSRKADRVKPELENRNPAIESTNDVKLSVSLPRVILALSFGVIWSIAAAITILIGNQIGSPMSPFVMFVLTCLTMIYYNILAATLSQMQSVEIESKSVVPSSTGWSYALERLVPLIVGPLFVGFGAGSFFAIGGTIIHSLSHLKSAGPFFGSLLLIPSILVLVGTVLLALAASIIPVIMGVEDCNSGDGIGIWKERFKKRPVQQLLDILLVWAQITPILLFTLSIICASVVVAVPITTDWIGLIDIKLSLISLLNVGSVCLVLGTWLAIAFVLSTSRLTEMYRARRNDVS